MFILTEKPSVARDIASALGGFKKENGYYSRGKDCIVSAAGHLLTLCEPDEYKPEWKNWNLTQLPIIPENYKYKPIPSAFVVLKKIKYCFQNFDSTDFILATDAEREGEYIGALILDYVGFKNYSTARRFWVSEALTPDVVLRGLRDAQPLVNYESYKKAGYARAKADWLIGINLSRLMTKSTQATEVLSVGRVQTAILSALYMRDKAINDFVPQNYYQLELSFIKDNIPFKMRLTDDDIDRFDKDDSFMNAAARLISKGSSVIISDIQSVQKQELPPQLFNLTGLQKYCSSQYKLSPEETLSIAQELYEELHCLSYPRTPSVVLGDNNVDLYKEKFELLSQKYTEESNFCNVAKITNTYKRLFNSAQLQDHHALIPLNVLPADATDKQKVVYQAVLERFFNVIKEPYVYNSIKIIATPNETSDSNFVFSTTGKTVVSEGWKKNISSDTDEDEVITLPALSKDEILKPSKLEIVEKQTKPKKHFTNATLLSLMENPKNEVQDDGIKLFGIGTPATRAAEIATLIKRGYTVQQKNNLIITKKGIFLIEAIKKIPSLAKFISIKTTTDWELQLGTDPDSFIDKISVFVKEEVPAMKIEDKWEQDNLGICPLCKKGKILSGSKSFYCSEFKEGCKFTFWKTCNNTAITEQDARNFLAGKLSSLKKMKSKNGNLFQARLKLVVTNEGTKFDFVFPDKNK